MPFGLSGAPGSFQRLMDMLFRDFSFVTTYLDDVLVHSQTAAEHKEHLRAVFSKLESAGLTLNGCKCTIGMYQVKYLGHVFSSNGMEPDPAKTSAVCNWSTPSDTSNLRSFLGLASYYRRYIHNFAEIAAPLHQLTNKGVKFEWTPSCQLAFNHLKQKLTEAPVLAYPQFGPAAEQFILQTDASANGIGAVLEQGGRVVGYASRTLSSAEKNYSVIQRECLAVIFALKQFRHYLLGCKFSLLTDHAPLQWLSSQKMEGLLARWALAFQEYNFTIVYRKGSENQNADALSRQFEHWDDQSAATLVTPPLTEDLKLHQQQDKVIFQLYEALLQDSKPPCAKQWSHLPLNRYRQLWPQLLIKNNLVCRRYTPGPTSEPLIVPIIPSTYQATLLFQYHDHPQAGHLGTDKTAAKIRQVGYWVGMLHDIDTYCQNCLVCQASKQPTPQKVPMINMPIGKPWDMIAVDILQVPVSSQNNKYLLVVQDYFTKWVEAIPLPDQTAKRVTRELVQVFAKYGLPTALHSDQGRNFESAMLQQTLDAFGIRKSRTTAYHPEGYGMVERFNHTLLQLLRTYTETHDEWEHYLPFVLFAYRTAVHSSTGVSPFALMFGRSPAQNPFPTKMAYDAVSYQSQLRTKLAQLSDFVETHLAQAAYKQKTAYDQHTQQRNFKIGNPVWLSSPTAGKLDFKWEGGWKILSVQGPATYTITDGTTTKTVHVNRLRPQILATPSHNNTGSEANWEAPSIEHDEIDPDVPVCGERRYPTRNRRPPDRLTF